MNVAPHWGTSSEVDKVAAVLKRVAHEGGVLVEGPFEEPDFGTFAVVEDCVGTFLRLWHSAPQHGGEILNVEAR